MYKVICVNLHLEPFCCFQKFSRDNLALNMTSTSGGVTDLSILQRAINQRNLAYKIGDFTPANGDCFLNGLKQNFDYFRALKLTDKNPQSIDEMRRKTIGFMMQNKSFFVGQENSEGIFQPGPLNEETFCLLIENQKRPGSYTDQDGWFVLSCCQMYDIELRILQTNVDSPIVASGMCGPLVTINRAEDDSRLVCHLGLIKDEANPDGVGHYQFIYLHQAPLNDLNAVPNNPGVLHSPLKLKKSRLVTQYLKSPSPKKIPEKSHCCFCHSNVESAEELEAHLSLSIECRQRYLQCMRVKDLTAYLVALSPCFFCKFSRGNFRISIHLKKNPGCLIKYNNRFGLNSLTDVIKQIEKLKKKLWDSRSRAKRRLETEKRQVKKQEKNAKLTVTDLVNQFKQDTSLTNVRQCISCYANLSESRAEELKVEDIPEELRDRKHCRRYQKFFICRGCKESKPLAPSINVKITKVPLSEGMAFVPTTNEDQGFESLSSSEPPYSVEKCIFPCNVESLLLIPGVKVKQRSQEASLIYKSGPISEEVVSLMYENELFKYLRAQNFGDKFSGVIMDQDRKLLTSTERLILDHVIVGSNSWCDVERRNKIHRLEQFGSILGCFSVSFPVSQDFIASCIVQNGIVVTPEFKARDSGEFDVSYQVHQHQFDTDCDEQCQSQTLPEFLLTTDQFNDNNLFKNHLSTYVSNIQLKMNSLVRNFLKSKASSLYSEDFHVEFEFMDNGSVKLKGHFWLKALEDMNISFSTYPVMNIDPDLKDKCLDFINSNLTSSCDEAILKDQFNLSGDESKQVSKMAEKLQFHFCRDQNCPRCGSVSLPSLVSLFIETPTSDFTLNIETCDQFNKMVREHLRTLPETEIMSRNSEEWLLSLFQSIILETQNIEGDIFRIKTSATNFDFMIDDRFLELSRKFQNQLLGAYHYSISCGDLSSSFGCVLKKTNLSDCFTNPYNIGLLKAFASPMELKIINGHQKVDVKKDIPIATFGDDFLATHNVITLTEAITLFDRDFSRSSSSTSVEYVNAVKERKTYFKKTSRETTQTFKDEKSGDIFELTHSNIDKYFNRTKGSSSLTLAEFIIFYDFTGSEESKQLMKIFSNPNVDIKSSDIRCAHNKDEFLPEFILTSSGDVLKLRRTKKVLSYPCYDDNESKLCFAKMILFYPLQDLIHEDGKISELVNKLDESGTRTIVERNERYFNWQYIYF